MGGRANTITIIKEEARLCKICKTNSRDLSITMQVCLHGTVFNSVATVEGAIKSVWRPDAEIVVVDNYSADGTWEKLLELRKDYNLKLYRYNCSRGLGRQIALCKCPEGSTVAYFDLDTVYNEAFHRVVDYGAELELRILAQTFIATFIAKREIILLRGGWRYLNYGEDVEMISRVGFDIAVPVVVGMNAKIPAHISTRERRYGKFWRVVKSSIDMLRGNGISVRRILINRSKRYVVFYLPARIMGFYRNRKPDNLTWLDMAVLAKLTPLRELNIPERYFSYVASLTLIRTVRGGEEAIDERVREVINTPVYKLYLRSRELKTIYFKDFELVDKSYLPLTRSLRILK